MDWFGVGRYHDGTYRVGKPMKENILDLIKYVDKQINVKFNFCYSYYIDYDKWKDGEEGLLEHGT